MSKPQAAYHDAVVLSETEEGLAAEFVASARRTGLVAVTRGARGCTLLDNRGAYEVPALHLPPEAIVDDTGAGDVFAAAFFIALAEGRPPAAAARFAHAAAALSLGGHGVGAIAPRAAIERALHAWEGEARGSGG